MQWDHVQRHAKREGRLVFAMDQGQTDVLNKPGPWGNITSAGYCLGLVASWVSLQYKGQNFPFGADKVCETPPWDSTIAQNASNDLYDKSPGGAGWFAQLRVAVRKYQCSPSAGLREFHNTSADSDFMWSVMCRAYGCYGVMIGGRLGSHIIALRHHRDDTYSAFDPNFFHIKMVTKPSFIGYMNLYFRSAGYFDDYGTKCAVVGIRPPS